MSSQNSSPKHLDLEEWVAQVSSDPVRHRERQLTHILLFAIGRNPVLREGMLLKGGTLLSAAYSSARQTGDIDFTVLMAVQPFTDTLRDVLNKALGLAAEELGYVDMRLKVQKIDPQPRKDNFETANSPALKVTIGSAERGTAEEGRLNQGMATQVLHIDLSFKEPVVKVEALSIGKDGSTIMAYSIEDVIAEKLRALLQQPTRNRNRRQDIYDIHWLVTRTGLSLEQRADVLKSLLEKSVARGIEAQKGSFDNPEIKARAQKEWNTMRQEVGELPDFEKAFAVVRGLYISLPW